MNWRYPCSNLGSRTVAKPKLKADDNRWYRLATLYGAPSSRSSDDDDTKLMARNRLTWNRCMASTVGEERRALLVKEASHSAEELKPFSQEELQEIQRVFAERSRVTGRIPERLHEMDPSYINFSDVEFDGPFSAEGLIFPGRSEWLNTTFSGGADFSHAIFINEADFEGAIFAHRAGIDNRAPIQPADFSHAIFSEDACFGGATFHGAATFGHAAFSGTAHFDRATFSSRANFEHVTFSKDATFVSVIIYDSANFVDAIFRGSADFNHAILNQEAEANFVGAIFSHAADFSVANFSGRTAFSQAKFTGSASFEGAVFPHTANFRGATFFETANFERVIFSRDTAFEAVNFSSEAYFQHTTFSSGVNFRRATFHGWTNFRATGFTSADFAGATFSGDVHRARGADFSRTTFSDTAIFVDAIFFDPVVFQGAAFSDGANFSRTIFHSSCSFINAEMKNTTSFEAATFSSWPPLFFGAKLHEGTVWRGATWPDPPRGIDQAGQFVDAYERLKLEMDRLRKHEDELNFFARELQSRRALFGDWKPVSELRFLGRTIPIGALEIPPTTIAPRSLKLFVWSLTVPGFTVGRQTIRLHRPAYGLPIALYGLLCDYGRSYVQPLLIHVAIIVIGAFLFWPHFGGLQLGRAIGLSFANTFGVLGVRKDLIDPVVIQSLPGWLKIIAAAQTIFGVVLLFLFSLALRNRFRMR
jgi:uncharacterized protein YjbI with pentapeptide repeats